MRLKYNRAKFGYETFNESKISTTDIKLLIRIFREPKNYYKIYIYENSMVYRYCIYEGLAYTLQEAKNDVLIELKIILEEKYRENLKEIENIKKNNSEIHNLIKEL